MDSNDVDSRSAIVFTAEATTHDEDCACPDGSLVLTFDEDERVDLENDCACPDTSRLSSRMWNPAQSFVRSSNTHIADLPRGFKLVYSPYAPLGPSVLNPPAWSRWKTFTVPQPLTQSVDRTFAAQRLILPHGDKPTARDSQPETLTCWLHITNACNLDCPYCYVRKSSARMREEIGLRAIERVFQTAQAHRFSRVKLKYAGGEPTLHFQLIRRVVEHAQRMSNETGIGLRQVVLSNGTRIKPEDADWFAKTGVKLMISLDGVGEMHNRLRAFKDGHESFAIIQDTVDRVLLPRQIRPDITITVTRVNAMGVADAVQWALERDLPVSLNFYRQNILSASRQELALEESAIIEGMLAAYAVFESHLPTRPFFNGLLDRVQAEAHTYTCGVGFSYLVISHDGKLAQCQMHLDKPANDTLDGSLLNRVASGVIRNFAVDEKVGCRDCAYRYRCTGSCPLETYHITGRWDVSSPNCRIYQTLFPVALRLEGLRLLKQHGYVS
ncbi:Anaerobic sulfatase-maturating enzyme [Anaerolineae bacterium]|nr:Anaerobic sulfatase-maturating enzyme [Anaerolineae bacterium]